MTFNARGTLQSLYQSPWSEDHLAAAADTLVKLKNEMLATSQPHLTPEAHAVKVQAALNHVVHNLIAEPGANGAPELLYKLDLSTLDFSFSEPVYSTVPRLLFKVPMRRDSHNVVDITPTDKPIPLSVQRADASTPDIVLRFANEEGDQPAVQDRPIVQLNAVKSGEYVIIGKIPLAGRDAVQQLVANVMQTPTDANPFLAFDKWGTVEQLGQILTGLRAMGHSNQYNTDEAYKNSLASIPDTNGGAEPRPDKASGFFEKPSQRYKAALLHLVGDFSMVTDGRAQEIVRGHGYALAEMKKDGARDRRPISADYAKTFNSCVDDEPLAPANELISTPSFPPDHPLGDFADAFNRFTARLAQVNATYVRGDSTPPAKLVASL